MINSFLLTNPRDAIAQLDTERHNMEYLLETNSRHITRFFGSELGYLYGELYDNGMSCLSIAINQYLGYRFSPEELIPPVQSAVNILRARLNFNWSARTYSAFTALTLSLASLIDTVKGAEEAFQLLNDSVC